VARKIDGLVCTQAGDVLDLDENELALGSYHTDTLEVYAPQSHALKRSFYDDRFWDTFHKGNVWEGVGLVLGDEYADECLGS
jgi:hypothetical protein